ncbi:hypothetical protein HUT19_01990 [Streptomyces sp. NA02950]|nr:hypothetical protein HUT19_01990 [Streptomyces sp. NA02950]
MPTEFGAGRPSTTDSGDGEKPVSSEALLEGLTTLIHSPGTITSSWDMPARPARLRDTRFFRDGTPTRLHATTARMRQVVAWSRVV